MQKVVIKKRRNFKKLFVGLLLVIIAAVILTYALANRQNPPQLAQIQPPVKRQVVPSPKVIAPAQHLPVAVPQVKNSISFKSLLERAEQVYDPSEKDRREGVLWLDRSTSRYVVTLGAINGLKPQDSLIVVEANKRIGEVIADTTFDVISYVHPTENTASRLRSNYYRVFIK